MEQARIRFLEELSFNAWPALQTIYYDGWLVRFAETYSRRANSVSPLYGSALKLEEKIQYCEERYRQRGQRVIFKITGAAYPADLDDILRDRGYVKEAPTSVQILALSGEGSPDAADNLTDDLTESWLNAFCRMNNITTTLIPAMRRLLGNIIPRRTFASLEQNGDLVAVGLGVLERRYLGIYDVVTDPDVRRQGLGMRLMLSLLSWGVANGAEFAYLQVMLDNQPALRLYQTLGFMELYQYWYRVKA